MIVLLLLLLLLLPLLPLLLGNGQVYALWAKHAFSINAYVTPSKTRHFQRGNPY